MSNAWEENARAQRERAIAEQARGEGTTYWARIERVANGQILERKTTNARVAEGWRKETHLRVLEHGEGVPPWEKSPELPSGAAGPTLQSASMMISADVVPTQSSPASLDSAMEPDPPMAATASATLAPALAKYNDAALGAPSTGPNIGLGPEVVNLLELVKHKDQRIVSAAQRLIKYLAQHRDRRYIAPRFLRKPEGPAGF